MVPSARLELALPKGKDFKSFVSTNFTTRARYYFIVIVSILIHKTFKEVKKNIFATSIYNFLIRPESL